MLTPEEELRVASCIDVTKHDAESTAHPTFQYPGLDFKTQLWLAQKCTELNDELKKAHELLNYAMHLRVHGENAPGGYETWKEFDRVNEFFLRESLK